MDSGNLRLLRSALHDRPVTIPGGVHPSCGTHGPWEEETRYSTKRNSRLLSNQQPTLRSTWRLTTRITESERVRWCGLSKGMSSCCERLPHRFDPSSSRCDTMQCGDAWVFLVALGRALLGLAVEEDSSQLCVVFVCAFLFRMFHIFCYLFGVHIIYYSSLKVILNDKPT